MRIVNKIPKRIRVGALQKKILILLLGRISLAFSRTPKGYFKITDSIVEEWKKVNRESLRKAIESLYESKLINFEEKPDGTVKLTLEYDGEQKALEYELENLKIKKPKQWDGKWRVVVFDVPHNLKKKRDAFRGHLRRLQFYQLQKSVFILPYECGDELEFLIEFYDIRRYVRQLIANGLDNELHLKEIFELRY